MNKRLKKYFLIFVGPLLLCFIVAFVIPFIMGVYLSFCQFNTVENVLRVLETEENQVEVDFNKRMGSLLPLERMLELGK